MKRHRRGIVLVVTLAVVATAAVLFLRPLNDAPLGGPPIEGQVQNFALAEGRGAGPVTPWRDSQGGLVRLADFQGKVVMVNFWATWCAPCIRELPSIDRLQAELSGGDFTVVAVNIDKGGKSIAGPFAERLGLRNLDLYLDAQSALARAVRVTVMPTTIIYDRQGQERGRLEGGAEWDTPEALALLRWFIQDQS
ncbi:MAG: TlpA disulfide reductase family protein [Alphaproteobacteria bacterium]